MSEDDILPCPFCGWETPLLHCLDAVMGMETHWVDCSECGASAIVAATQDEAITAWNTRADPALAAAQAEVAALKNLLYRWQASGCPHCPGDCAGANPPSATCIVRATAAALVTP